MKHYITVFTPTYNRADLLPQLFESLKNQTFKDFEWLIVDDGSSDDTKDVVKKFKSESLIKIKYHYKENGGKHRAINKGLDLASGELFFIVDSDDQLPKDSLEVIAEYSGKINNEVVGVVGRKQYRNHTIIGGNFVEREFISDPITRAYVLELKGDFAEVVKTEILKRCKFPDFEGEKFCAEGMMWNQISRKGYKLYYFDIPVYNAEYLEDGLSANSIRNRRNSARYATQLYKELGEFNSLPLNQKLKSYINYWRFSFFNGKTIQNNYKFIKNPIIGFIAFPIGLFATLLDFINLQKK